MESSSLLSFGAEFILAAALVSFWCIRLTRQRGIFLIVLIIVAYNLAWDAIGLRFGIELVHQRELRVFGVLVGFVVVVAAVLSLPIFFARLQRGRLSLTRYDVWNIMLPAVVGVLGFVVGWVRGNDLGYLLSDTYKLLVVSAAYFISLVNVRGEEEARLVFGVLIALVAFQQLLDVVLFGLRWRLAGKMVRVADQFWVNKLLLLPFLGVALGARLSKSQLMRYGSALVVTMLSVFVSMYRTALIVGGVLLLLAVPLRKCPRLVRNLVAIAILVLFISAFLISLLRAGGLGGQMVWKLGKVFDAFRTRLESMGVTDTSMEVKLVEIQSVLREFRTNGTLLEWLGGFGAGAQYGASEVSRVSAGFLRWEQMFGPSGQVHHIHNFFFAALFRYGLTGILLLLVLFLQISIALSMWQKRVRGTPSWSIMRSILLYWVGTLLVLNLFPFFWGDVNWGVLLALASVIGKDYRRRR
ncbi:MAG TPA: hypothetical protein G4O00_09610 [Thermoflexia bacterium]|nr:hypothetical protein [Thermoflexia bacterium]